MRKKIVSVLRHLDLTRWIATNLIGVKHTTRHRKLSGICVMLIGVGLTQLAGLCSLHVIHFFADVIGYGLHGIGLIPFVDVVEKMAE